MRYFWLAVQIQENGKFYACIMRVGESDNLVSKLSLKGFTTANICKSKKQAAEIVTFWNEAHKANGRYMFDTPQFLRGYIL